MSNTNLKSRSQLVGLISLASASFMPLPAAAQNAEECVCRGSFPNGANIVGAVTEMSGDVFFSRREGFAPVTVGSSFPAGTRLMVGSKSSVSVKVGKECVVQASENSAIDVKAVKGGQCVVVSSTAPRQVTPLATGAATAPFGVYPLVGLAGAAGIAIIVDQSRDGDDPVSR